MRYLLIIFFLTACGQSNNSNTPGSADNTVTQNAAKSTFVFDVSARTATLNNSYSFWPDWASLDNATIDKIVIYEPGFGKVSVDPGDNNSDKIIKSYSLSTLIEQGNQSVDIELDNCTVQTVDFCVIPTEGYLNTSVRPDIYGDCSEISLQCQALYRCRIDYLVNYHGFSFFGETDFRKAVSIDCI